MATWPIPKRLRVTDHLRHIRSLEDYVERCGARLVRGALPEWVHGRSCRELITLRIDLTPEQELPALVHEVAHWLAHRDASPGLCCAGPGLYCTVFEYEAEAVEALVMARLGLTQHRIDADAFADDEPTDGLLSASVTRVITAGSTICRALGLEAEPASEPQAAVHVETTAGEEIILEYEHHGVSDFLGLPQPL